jgi:hypothetical protein
VGITDIWAPAVRSHPRDALTRNLLQILSKWEDSGDAAVLVEPSQLDRVRRLQGAAAAI